MNTDVSNVNFRSPCKSYLKAVAFIGPALFVWGFSCIFFLPKLREIWSAAGFTASALHTALNAAMFLTEHWILIGVGVFASLVLLESRSARWAFYRAAVLEVIVFLLNTSILILIAGLFASLLYVAPALIRGN